MSLDFDFIKSQVASANALTAGAMGAPASGFNLTGPNGEKKSAVFRVANPIEQLTADKEMTLHGFKDRTVQYAVVSAAQFSNNPALALAWRGKTVTQTSPLTQTALVSDVEVEDPFWYTFVLLCRQAPRNG